MPSVSKSQKSLACMALAMKRGKMKHEFSAQAHKMMQSMSEDELKEYCEGPANPDKSGEKKEPM